MAYSNGIDYANEAIGKLGGTDVKNFATSLPGAQAGLINKQTGESSNYLDRFRQAIMGQEALPHMYTRIGDELGLPQAQQAYLNVNKTLAELPETYTAATRGTDTNANQLSRIIGTKSAALAPLAETTSTAYKNLQDQQNAMIAAEQANQAKQLKPFETEQSFLTDRWAREQTGFTSANEQELNGLIAKMQSGVQLSEGEQSRINQLSIAEKQMQNAKDIASMQIASSEKIARQNNLTALASKF